MLSVKSSTGRIFWFLDRLRSDEYDRLAKGATEYDESKGTEQFKARYLFLGALKFIRVMQNLSPLFVTQS
jgi:hypothetical protein